MKERALTCTCGSTDLFQAQFRQYATSGFSINSTQTGFFNEVIIVPEVWVCRGCRGVSFRIPEDKLEIVAPHPDAKP